MIELETGGLTFVAGNWPLDKSKATVIFIHGAGGSANFWSNQVVTLKDRVNTIAIDLPGHGRSKRPGMEKVGDYARAVSGFISSVAPDAIPVGLSMGGAITQQLLLDHPGRFRAAVLSSTGARLRVIPVIFEAIQNDFPKFIELMGQFSASSKTPLELIKPCMDDTARQKPEVILGDFRACNVFDVRERLGEIKTPVLIISAEDDLLTPPKFGELLEQKIPGSRRVHILDSGHMIPVEKPEEFNRAMIEFLDGHKL
ncbi:MAG: alpha/beta hydrolase [bacterium]|nr:alpha/beta hydrolase [bacterium]